MPSLVPIPILKSTIVDTVASGDLPLMNLLQSNIDMLWALNQRRSTAQVVQFHYTLADAIRMGLEHTRSAIDAAQTDSEALAIKRARQLASRIYDASNSASGSVVLTVDGTGRDDEVSTKQSDLTNTSNDHSDHYVNGFSNGTDFSGTAANTVRDTSQFTNSAINNRTSESDSSSTVSGSQYNDTTFAPFTDIQSGVEDVQLGLVSKIVPVSLGYRRGLLSGGSLTGPGPFLAATSTITKNIVGGGTVADEFGSGDFLTSQTDVSNRLTVDDSTIISGGGILQGGASTVAEIGGGSNSITKRVHSNGGLTTIDHATRNTSHIASASVHNHSDVSANQVSVTTASSLANSSAVDASHSEAHELGESSEILTGTIDYLGQLFTNLKTMYTNVMAQIAAFESQIAVGTRYVNNRMTTKVPPSPLPCNTSVTWLSGNTPLNWWG